MIFDGHAYCFPDVRELMGFPTLEDQRKHIQKSLANHHVPPWRATDRARGSSGMLIDDARWPDDDALSDVDFRPTSHGRFQWTVGGEDWVTQSFPPSLVGMASPPENLIAEMDYANIEGALLHRNPYLGLGNDFIADCVRQYPNRLFGLAHVPEWEVEEHPEAMAAEVVSAVRQKGMSGYQFLASQLRLKGKPTDFSAESFRPFWDDVTALDVPVFFSLNINEPATRPRRDNYLRRLARLGKWAEQFPDTSAVLTHGFPWSLFMDGERFDPPEELWEPFENPNLALELLFPIALGGTWDYPMPQVRPMFEECVRRLGADRLIWGTDMPMVMRYWTYQQNVDFIVDYCDFLSGTELDLIMGGTVARLLGVD